MPFITESLQLARRHAPWLHTALAQSVSTAQCASSPQGGHEPPQSVSVSLPFRRPSSQRGVPASGVLSVLPPAPPVVGATPPFDGATPPLDGAPPASPVAPPAPASFVTVPPSGRCCLPPPAESESRSDGTRQPCASRAPTKARTTRNDGRTTTSYRSRTLAVERLRADRPTRSCERRVSLASQTIAPRALVSSGRVNRLAFRERAEGAYVGEPRTGHQRLVMASSWLLSGANRPRASRGSRVAARRVRRSWRATPLLARARRADRAPARRGSSRSSTIWR